MHNLLSFRHQAALLLATLLVAAGCSTNPSTGRNQLILLSSSQVSAMGEAAAPQLTEEYGGEVKSAEVRDYVDWVGRRLVAQVEEEYGDIEWTFTVLDSEILNAFALPGGKVFVSRGLMERLDDEAQLAGVLGHEIGHVTARHVDERLSQAVAVEVGLAVIGQATESQLALAGAQVFSQGYQLKFGRDQESESDWQGVKYMTLAGYDPRGMRGVLEVLRDAASGGGQPPEFLSTHPHPETRIRTVDRLLSNEYAYAVDNPEFKTFAGRYKERALDHLLADP